MLHNYFIVLIYKMLSNKIIHLFVVIGLIILQIRLQLHNWYNSNIQYNINQDLSPYSKLEILTNITNSANVNTSIQSDNQYLALCLVVRDDYDDLNEWIEYHYRKGVSKFYIIDHNSKYPLNDYIMPYIRNNLVSYYYLDRPVKTIPNPQLIAYRYCLRDFSSKHTFMGFIDYDEFIVTSNETLSIPDVLKDYEEFGGLALNWLIYGHSNHIERPDGGVRNYDTCERNQHVKTIVNIKAKPTVRGDPHNFDYQSGLFTVDTNKNKVEGAFNQPTDSLYSIMHVNHYVYKSKDEYYKKVLRGRVSGNPNSIDIWKKFGNISTKCKPLQYPNVNYIKIINNNNQSIDNNY